LPPGHKNRLFREDENDFDDDDYKSIWTIDFNNATIWDLKTGYEDEGYEHEFTRCARQDSQED